MTRKKIHIDELFRNGLKNLSLLVSNKDLEAIDGKKSRYSDSEQMKEKDSPFSDFELEVTEADWLATRAKLDAEKAAMSQDNLFAKGFADFEMELQPGDWTETFRRYRETRRRRRYLWTGTGLLILLFIAVASLIFLLPGKEKQLSSVVQSQSTVKSHTPHTEENTAPDKTISAGETPGGDINLPEAEQRISSGAVKSAVKPADPAAGKEAAKGSVNPEGRKAATKPVALPEAPVASPAAEPAGDFIKEDDLSATPAKVAVAPTSPQETPAMQKSEPASVKNNVPSPFAKAGDTAVKTSFAAPLPKDTPVQNSSNGKGKVPPVKVPGFYAAFGSVFSAAYRYLPATNNELYNRVRNDGEKPALHISSGIEFGMTYGRNRLNTGIQTAEQRFATHYKYSYRVYDSLPVWNPGRTRIIGYFLVRGRDTSIDESNEIRIRTVSVPFEYARMFRVGRNTNVLAGAGMLFSWNAGSSGSKILNPANNQLYAYAGFRSFERNLNLSPSLNAAVQNRLKGNWWLETGLSGSTALYSRFTGNFPAREFNYRAGINIKIIYMLK